MHKGHYLVLSLCLAVLSGQATAGEKPVAEIVWHTDYAKAMTDAERQGKMLLAVFREPGEDRLSDHFESRVLGSPSIHRRLQDWVCVKIPRDVKIRVAGKETIVLDHAAFAGQGHSSGVAILDFAHREAEYYGCVVSTFPFADGCCYSARQMEIILGLPPGRPERRAAEYASRTRPTVVAEKPCEIPWMNDYAKAMAEADLRNKMLFIYFCDDCGDGVCNRFKAETLDDPQVQRKLRDYVCVQVSMNEKIKIGGKEIKLLEHEAYQEMLGRPGIAIVDYRTGGAKLRGAVVSMFPITEKLWYTPERMAVILNLPPGTLTQRTLIYAVRIHPDRPASANSELSADLVDEAQSHSQYQAAIRLQGHHQWDSRFQRIIGRLPGGLSAREVCAESWPGEHLVEAAIECVRCWRLSEGHWSAVGAPNRFFGYDMKRGDNGIWYATGIFGAR